MWYSARPFFESVHTPATPDAEHMWEEVIQLIPELEHIDASGGPELPGEIATVSGLKAFSTLIDVLIAAHASVQVLSPPKLEINMPTVKPVPQ